MDFCCCFNLRFYPGVPSCAHFQPHYWVCLKSLSSAGPGSREEAPESLQGRFSLGRQCQGCRTHWMLLTSIPFRGPTENSPSSSFTPNRLDHKRARNSRGEMLKNRRQPLSSLKYLSVVELFFLFFNWASSITNHTLDVFLTLKTLTGKKRLRVTSTEHNS